MDLTNLLNAAADQDAMFWAAAAAVALGLTLIAVAALAQTRRLKRAVGGPRTADHEPAVPARKVLPATGPAASRPVPTPPATFVDDADAVRIGELLVRVRRMAAIVDSWRHRAGTPIFETDESLLKESDGDVEYIYRAENG